MGIRVKSTHRLGTSAEVSLLGLLLASLLGLGADGRRRRLCIRPSPANTERKGPPPPGSVAAARSPTTPTPAGSSSPPTKRSLASNGRPGERRSAGGNFPIAADNLTACGDADIEVDNTRDASAGNLYLAGAYPPKVSGWDWTGRPSAGLGPHLPRLPLLRIGDDRQRRTVGRPLLPGKGNRQTLCTGRAARNFLSGFNVCKMAD